GRGEGGGGDVGGGGGGGGRSGGRQGALGQGEAVRPPIGGVVGRPLQHRLGGHTQQLDRHPRGRHKSASGFTEGVQHAAARRVVNERRDERKRAGSAAAEAGENLEQPGHRCLITAAGGDHERVGRIGHQGAGHR